MTLWRHLSSLLHCKRRSPPRRVRFQGDIGPMTKSSPPGAGAGQIGLFRQPPVAMARLPDGTVLLDFGRVAFGNLELGHPGGPGLTLHFGEDLREGRINRSPSGSVRYARVDLPAHSPGPVRVEPEPIGRHLQPPAILTPADWGVILPFRWVEIEGWPEGVPFGIHQAVRLARFAASWLDEAATFQCDDPMLNAIWDLCRYTIKATTFCGLYVDGDRERIPYEADAYINQLSHYCCDPDPTIARATIDHLIDAPTWPTEWASHLVFMVHEEWMRSADKAWLAGRYEAMKGKLLRARERADGLITTDPKHLKGDLVDWPRGERDGFVFTPENSVVNAFHIQSLKLMRHLAGALKRREEVASYEDEIRRKIRLFRRTFVEPGSGLVRDGASTPHCSFHATLFAVAFDLISPERRVPMLDFLVGKGMACSVYAAQYLLEALFKNGREREGLALITAPGDRSWRHMVERGATLTWEAWDHAYKPNQDWNHAWGSAPANILPRFVGGIRPHRHGWGSALIAPQPGPLRTCTVRMPTPQGLVNVSWRRDGSGFHLTYDTPAAMPVVLSLPCPSGTVRMDGVAVDATPQGDRLLMTGAPAGAHWVSVD